MVLFVVSAAPMVFALSLMLGLKNIRSDFPELNDQRIAHFYRLMIPVGEAQNISLDDSCLPMFDIHAI